MNLKHKNQGVGKNGMAIGDIVEISNIRLNWFGIPFKSDNAYAGYIGRVVDIWEDRGFSLFSGSSWLVVPAYGPREKDHIGVKINGQFYFYYFKRKNRTFYGRVKSFFRKLILPLFYKII